MGFKSSCRRTAAILASIIPVVNLFTGLVLTGYGLRVLKQVSDGSDTPLPKWDDWGGDWIKGLLVAAAAVIYSVPIWLISGVGAGIEALSRSGSSEGVVAVCVTGASCFGEPLGPGHEPRAASRHLSVCQDRRIW